MCRVFNELGYRRSEGTFRQETICKGRNRAIVRFSVIDQDCPALRHGFAAWLDSRNFDSAGTQRRGSSELYLNPNAA
jgi:hypothetical protein